MADSLDYETPLHREASPVPSICLYAGLVLVGVAFLVWTTLARLVSNWEWCLAPLGLLFGLLPAPARHIKQFSDWLDALPPRRHRWLIGILCVVLPVHLMTAAWIGHRALVPLMHDEQMYLLQARQLAAGHLAMPALPLGEFFDTFYVFVKPVYASMYFPGTALAYVPSIWLNLPYVVWPLLIMTGLLVMTYLVAARVLGRFLGLIALFAMLAAGPMNWIPTASMSHPLGGMFGMTAIYAWLRWRERPRIGWAILLGAAAGWMAITRPLESLVFGVPILVAIACATRRRTLAVTLRHGIIAILCTIPFLGLQLLDNHVITGHWTKLPISMYVEQEFPGMSSLGKASPDLQTTSTLPQKQAMMKAFVTPTLRRQARESNWAGLKSRTIFVFDTASASPLLFVLIPLSLALLVRQTAMRVIWAILISFIVAYGIYGGYFAQYSSQVMSVLSILIVAGARDMCDRLPRYSGAILGSYCGVVVVTTAVVLCIMPKSADGGPYDWSIMRFNYGRLEKVVQKPALVMIRFGEKSSPFVEPVYNISTAWPDDAEVIRAHDFGPQRDLALFRYYADKQPQRNVYLFDRDTLALKPLGTVGDLVRSADAAAGKLGAKSAPATKPAAATEPQ